MISTTYSRSSVHVRACTSGARVHMRVPVRGGMQARGARDTYSPTAVTFIRISEHLHSPSCRNYTTL